MALGIDPPNRWNSQSSHLITQDCFIFKSTPVAQKHVRTGWICLVRHSWAPEKLLWLLLSVGREKAGHSQGYCLDIYIAGKGDMDEKIRWKGSLKEAEDVNLLGKSREDQISDGLLKKASCDNEDQALARVTRLGNILEGADSSFFIRHSSLWWLTNIFHCHSSPSFQTPLTTRGSK